MIIGIDASRNRSGGAIAHIRGILSLKSLQAYGIEKIHLWAYEKLLEEIPDQPWLIKHAAKELEQNLAKQLYWQAFKLSDAVRKHNCNILFTTDASTLCRFKPMVVLSQDMLSYEPGIMKHFGLTIARARLLAILFIQNSAMRHSDGTIFLTRYASHVIQKSSGALNNVKVIPHGIDQIFKTNTSENIGWPNEPKNPIKCLYVSNTAMYKHQWQVVKAISLLRKKNINATITFAGGGKGNAQRLLEKEIELLDPKREFTILADRVSHDQLPVFISQHHIFIFASSCENLPVTLLEGMSSDIPIACSDRGPMPEVLEDAGFYFNPEDHVSIAHAVKLIIQNQEKRDFIAQKAKHLSEQYNWRRCADETWKFVTNTYKSIS